MAAKISPDVAKKQSKSVFCEKKGDSAEHKSRFSCFVNAGKAAPPGPNLAAVPNLANGPNLIPGHNLARGHNLASGPNLTSGANPAPGDNLAPDFNLAPKMLNHQTRLQDVFLRQISGFHEACSEAQQDITPSLEAQLDFRPHSQRHPDDTSASCPSLSMDRLSSHSDSTLNIIRCISSLSSWDVDDELMVAQQASNVNITTNNKLVSDQHQHNSSERGLQQLRPQWWKSVKFEDFLLLPNKTQEDSTADDPPAVHIIAPIKNRDPSPETQRQGVSLPFKTRGKAQIIAKRRSSSTNALDASKDLKISPAKPQPRKTCQDKNAVPPRFNRFGGLYIGLQVAPLSFVPREEKHQNTKWGSKLENKDKPPTANNPKPNIWKTNNRWKKTQANNQTDGSNKSPPNITSSNVHSQPREEKGSKLQGTSEPERESQHYLHKPLGRHRSHTLNNNPELWRRMLRTHKSKFLMTSSRLKKRVDWSTGSGYADSISRRNHNWLTGWGMSKEEMLLTAHNDNTKSLQASLGRSLSHSLEKKTNASVNYSLLLTTVKELSDNTSLQTLLDSHKASSKRNHSSLSNKEIVQAPVVEKVRKVIKKNHSVYSTDISMNISDTRSIRSEWTSNGLGTTITSEWDSLPGTITRYCDGDTQEQFDTLQRLKTKVFNIRWSCGNICPDDLFLKTQNIPMVSLSDISDYAVQIGEPTNKSQNQEAYMPVVKAGFNSNTRRTIERSCQDSPPLTRRSSAILSEAIFSQDNRFFSVTCLPHKPEMISQANSSENLPVSFVGGSDSAPTPDRMNGKNGALKRWLGGQEVARESLMQTYGMVANFTRNVWVKKAMYRLRKRPNEFKRTPDSSWKWPIFLLIVVFIIFMCLLLAYMLTSTSLNTKGTTEPL